MFLKWEEYREFELEVSRKRRFVYTDKTRNFLDNVKDTARSRARRIRQGALLWRAQGGHREYDVEGGDYNTYPHKPKRMKPLTYCAADGRANSRGIPCLYLATKQSIAISEIRPWIGSYVSVGAFEVQRDLNVVDCSLAEFNFLDVLEENLDSDVEQQVWGQINNAFSQPVTVRDNMADYIPTQILCELFKSCGFDGVAYKSQFSKGDDEPSHNIALFDLDAAKIRACNLHKVKSLKVETSDVGGSYTC